MKQLSKLMIKRKGIPMANKRLTDKELDEIIKFSIDPSNALKTDQDAEKLAEIGTKAVRVSDVVNMINNIVDYREEGLDRELGLLEYIIEDKLKLKKREVKRYTSEYTKKLDSKIKESKEKIEESEANG